MEKNKKILFNSVLVMVFLVFYSFYSYNVLGFFKIINNNKVKSMASLAKEVNPDNLDIIKNNQDLLNVDYTKYYDDLEPYGTWIKINLSDYVPDKNKQKEKTGISDALRNLLGVSDAKADMDFGWGIFYVWKPFPTLAINIVAGEPSPEYIPYTNGQWVYSDYGWYFRGATYQEEIVHHYGRWIFVPDEGWIWVPGSTWAPSWVDWEENDDYISWTPSTPCFYHDNDYYTVPYDWQNNCVVVEKRHFLDPYVYRYSHEYRRHDERHEFRDMKRVHGLDFRDRMVYNDGPDFKNIEKNYGRRINPVNINMVSNREDVRYNKKQFDVYSYGAGNKNIQNGKSDVFQKFSGNKFSSNENFGLKNKESGKNNTSLANNKSRDNASLNRNQNYTKNNDNGANNLKQELNKGNNNNTLSNNLNTRDNKKMNIGNSKNDQKKLNSSSKNFDNGYNNNARNKVKNNDQVKSNNNSGNKNNTYNKNSDNGYNNNARNKVKNNEQVKSNNNSGNRNNTYNKNSDNGYNNNTRNKVKNNVQIKPDNNTGKRNNTSNQTRVNGNKINSGNKTNNNNRGNTVNNNQKKDNSSKLNQYKGNDVKQNNRNGSINKNNAGNNSGKRQYIDDTKMSPHNNNNYISPKNNTGNNSKNVKIDGKRNKK